MQDLWIGETDEGVVEFAVQGEPQSQGSKTVHHRGTRTWATEGGDAATINRKKAWRQLVHDAAVEAMGFRDLFDGPLLLQATFVFGYLAAHRRANGELKANVPTYKETNPDVSKLVRSIEDSMQGVVYTNDARIAKLEITKVYGEKPGVYVKVTRL
jgi:Holliday junction resolvase RusA-like endonuclease